jgi:hypothetical protein
MFFASIGLSSGNVASALSTGAAIPLIGFGLTLYLTVCCLQPEIPSLVVIDWIFPFIDLLFTAYGLEFRSLYQPPV